MLHFRPIHTTPISFTPYTKISHAKHNNSRHDELNVYAEMVGSLNTDIFLSD